MGFRSENVGVQSPVTKYIEWSSNDKGFKYYDKEKGEKVDVKMPLEFILMDDMLGVSGGEMDDNDVFHPVRSGIVAHVGKTLSVKKDGQTFITGKWADIKDKVKAEGGRYTSYAYAILGDELVCFKLAGAALASWFEKGNGAKITVKKSEEKKKGAVKYYSPIFEAEELSDDVAEGLETNENVKAFDAYNEAKKAQKFAGDDEEEQSEAVEPVQADLSDEDDLFDESRV